MCGVLGIFDTQNLTKDQLRKLALAASKLLRHRGPDWSGIYLYFSDDSGNSLASNSPASLPRPTTFKPALANHSNGNSASKEAKETVAIKNCVLAHERLSIVDPQSGAQPLFSADKSLVLSVNGEIYNHKVHRADANLPYQYYTNSDCEVILPLYLKYGVECVIHLDGMFAFVLWDEKNKSFFAARDHMGICPLYIGWRSDGGILFASELKALQATCERFEIFPPGSYFTSDTYEFGTWYKPVWYQPDYIPSQEVDYAMIRIKFAQAVKKRMMSDVPWGVLLSGGLDSSLVASVALREIKASATGAEKISWPMIHSFSVGLKGSPDLEAAQKVAEFLGTTHHNFTFSIQEGLDAVSDVIYYLETYDVTTIRAATPMYLMARKIKAMGVKMVLSGEGADECLGGYLYFHKAPNASAFFTETVQKLKLLHYYDCLRANKAMSSFGVEPRVPFLDREWLNFIMAVDAKHKMVKKESTSSGKEVKIEKYILRRAFDTPDKPYLPESVLWRQKEQFSDGVGYGWIDALRDKANREVSASQWTTRAKRFPKNTPASKEAYVYRAIFTQHFPGESARDTVLGGATVACSTSAAIEWSEDFKKIASGVGGENSGRAILGVHNSAYSDVINEVSGASSNLVQNSGVTENKDIKIGNSSKKQKIES